MNRDELRRLLAGVKDGSLSPDDAFDQLKLLPYDDHGFAKIDHHRAVRKGFGEVVFCQGKTPEQVATILERLSASGSPTLATRADPETFAVVRRSIPDAVYHEQARCIVVGQSKRPEHGPCVLVVTAGTADIPVAEEAAITADVMGSRVDRLYDVGVAGLHRLLDNRGRLLTANVIVAVAGMEGALPSVLGGMAEQPIIAVPTSVGYGASFHGLSALLTMLNTCAPGVAVVNIDNGFGAGYLAAVINQMGLRGHE
ncbi:MAG: nickel pincer cofactor biosynthesis protein LarB [Chloroflexota bacterium]|nr:MAG: nickel pincer cofactor biosynthesis protein LarB [Chloroflexota bacterium]